MDTNVPNSMTILYSFSLLIESYAFLTSLNISRTSLLYFHILLIIWRMQNIWSEIDLHVETQYGPWCFSRCTDL